jgi:hypothetical protein
MSAFYWPTVLWVEYPVLTVVPGIIFGAAFWHLRQSGRPRWTLLVVTVLWASYAVYEGVMYAWAQQVIASIRIDLIVLGPAMYVVTAVSLVSWWRARSGSSAGSR